MHKLPSEAAEYIRDHFREDYLVEVQAVQDKHGHPVFKVNLTQGDVIHHLRFNEKGHLMTHSAEPKFEEDYYENSFYGMEA